MYYTTTIQINQSHPLFQYCDAVTKAANNLKNATLFRVRQVLTMVEKPAEQLTQNEREVYKEIEDALPLMGTKYKMPQRGRATLSYTFLDMLMKVTHNPDYCNPVLPKHGAQHILKEVTKDMKSFREAMKEYRINPDRFTGKPRLPGYAHKGGNHEVTFSNQECKLCEKNGVLVLKLPKVKQYLNFESVPLTGRLKEVKIVPSHGVFVLAVTTDDERDPSPCKESTNICAIDVGVNNFAAITNNLGKECLLFKGGVIKSINQYYNKKMAQIISEQTKGTTDKFQPTQESRELELKRHNGIEDYIHKTAKRIIDWCLDNDIDTIVVGVNKYWKQNAEMGKRENQNFVQIPFTKLRWYLKYRAERAGINYIEREESYTSKASFLLNDPIPTYGDDVDDVTFAGRRFCRGLYRNRDGSIVNADLNGSANILRKEFPDAFSKGVMPDFSNVTIIKHPDYNFAIQNREKQMLNAMPPSKAKQKRDAKRQRKVIPMG